MENMKDTDLLEDGRARHFRGNRGLHAQLLRIGFLSARRLRDVRAWRCAARGTHLILGSVGLLRSGLGSRARRGREGVLAGEDVYEKVELVGLADGLGDVST